MVHFASYFIEENIYQMTAESPADERNYYVYNIVLFVGSQHNCAVIATSNSSYQAERCNTQWSLKKLSCMLDAEWCFFLKVDLNKIHRRKKINFCSRDI